MKNHAHGALNPHAQYRDLITVEQVLTSRTITEPLTLLMCSPIGDGAAAVVVCSDAVARRLGADAVRLRGSALVSGTVDRPGDGPSPVARAAHRAYEQAGLGPMDVDVVEVHDAFGARRTGRLRRAVALWRRRGARHLRAGRSSAVASP